MARSASVHQRLAPAFAVGLLIILFIALIPIGNPAVPTATFGANVTTSTTNFKPSQEATGQVWYLGREERGTNPDLNDDFFYLHQGVGTTVLAGDVRFGGATVSGRTTGTIVKGGDTDSGVTISIFDCNGGGVTAADAINGAGTCLRFLELDGIAGYTTGDLVYLETNAGGIACTGTTADLSPCDLRVVTRTVGTSVAAGTMVLNTGVDYVEAGDADGVLPDTRTTTTPVVADIAVTMFDANEDNVASTDGTTADTIYLRLDDAGDTLAVQTGPGAAGAFVAQVGDIRLTPYGSLAAGTVVGAGEADLLPTLQAAPGPPRVARIGTAGSAVARIILTWGDGTQIHYGDIALNTVSGSIACAGTSSQTAGAMITTAAGCLGKNTDANDGDGDGVVNAPDDLINELIFFIDRSPTGYGSEDCVYLNVDESLGGTNDDRQITALDIRLTACETFAAGSVVATADADRSSYAGVTGTEMVLKWFDADRGQSLQSLRALTNGAKVVTGGTAGDLETGEAAYVPVAAADATVLNNFVRITGIDHAEATATAAQHVDTGEALGGALANFRIDTGGVAGTFEAGEDAYIDADASNTVTIGDTRLTPVSAGGNNYAAGSVVAAGQTDIAGALSAATNDVCVTGADAVWLAPSDIATYTETPAYREFVYIDVDAIGGCPGTVPAAATRVTRVFYAAASTVDCTTVPNHIDCAKGVSTLNNARVTGADGAWTSASEAVYVDVNTNGRADAGDLRLASPTFNDCCAITVASTVAPVAVAAPNGDAIVSGRAGSGDSLYAAFNNVANAKIAQLNDVRLLAYGSLAFGSRVDATSSNTDYSPWVRVPGATLRFQRWDKGTGGAFNDDAFYLTQGAALASGDGRLIGVFTYNAGTKFLPEHTDSNAALAQLVADATTRVFYVNQQAGKPATYDSTDYVYLDIEGNGGLTQFDLRLKSATADGVTYAAGTMTFAADKDRVTWGSSAVTDPDGGGGNVFLLKYMDHDNDGAIDTTEDYVLSVDAAAAPSVILLLGDLYVSGTGGSGSTTSTTTTTTTTAATTTLTAGSVSPAFGNDGSSFTFSVTYKDSQNRAPTTANLVLGGTSYAMTTTDTTYSDGSSYTLARTLTAPTSAPYSYAYSFSFVVGGTTYTGTGGTVYVNPTTNVAPTLTAGTVAPSAGTSATSFTWSVTYTDANNAAPTVKKVTINGVDHTMTSTDTTYYDGAVFTYSQTLDVGSAHTFVFEFSDGTTIVKLPTTGTSTGPTVTSAATTPTTPTTGGTTDTSTSATNTTTSSSKKKPSPGFEVVAVGLGVVAALVIVARRRRSE